MVTCQSGRWAASAAPPITERAALPVQRKTTGPAHVTRSRARIGQVVRPGSGSTSPPHDLDARGDEEVVDLVAGAAAPATSCRGPRAASPVGSWRRSSSPTCSCRPRARPAGRPAAARAAGRGSGAARRTRGGEKWVATTVRLVPSTSISACEQHPRSTGRGAAAAASIVRVAADRLAREQREAPVAARRAPVGVGPADQVRLGLERRTAPSARRRRSHPQRLRDLVVLGDAAVGRPRLLEHDHVGLEGRAGGGDVERAASRRATVPAAPVHVEARQGQLRHAGQAFPGQRAMQAGSSASDVEHGEVVQRRDRARRARAPRSPRRARARPGRRAPGPGSTSLRTELPTITNVTGRCGGARGCAGRWPRPSPTRSPPARTARRARSGRPSSPGGGGRPW